MGGRLSCTAWAAWACSIMPPKAQRHDRPARELRSTGCARGAFGVVITASRPGWLTLERHRWSIYTRQNLRGNPPPCTTGRAALHGASASDRAGSVPDLELHCGESGEFPSARVKRLDQSAFRRSCHAASRASSIAYALPPARSATTMAVTCGALHMGVAGLGCQAAWSSALVRCQRSGPRIRSASVSNW